MMLRVNIVLLLQQLSCSFAGTVYLIMLPRLAGARLRRLGGSQSDEFNLQSKWTADLTRRGLPAPLC